MSNGLLRHMIHVTFSHLTSFLKIELLPQQPAPPWTRSEQQFPITLQPAQESSFPKAEGSRSTKARGTVILSLSAPSLGEVRYNSACSRLGVTASTTTLVPEIVYVTDILSVSETPLATVRIPIYITPESASSSTYRRPSV